MPTPGVYVTESTILAPVQSAAVTDAAGVLVAELPQGPSNLTLVTSWYQFSNIYGGLSTNYVASFGAQMFFRAGGTELYILRAVKSDAVASSGVLKTTDASTWITFTAKGAGTYGNDLRVKLVKNSSNLWDLTVLKEAGVADTIVSGLISCHTDQTTYLLSGTRHHLLRRSLQELASLFHCLVDQTAQAMQTTQE